MQAAGIVILFGLLALMVDQPITVLVILPVLALLFIKP